VPTFSPISISRKLKCPWCGTTTLDILAGEKTCLCRTCKRTFKICIIDLPDPNSKSGQKHCGRKIGHASVDDAYRHCLELELKDIPHRYAKTLCVYLCKLCAKWHVGHKSKRKHYPYIESFLFTVLKQERQPSTSLERE
jgi:hypothetical protein